VNSSVGDFITAESLSKVYHSGKPDEMAAVREVSLGLAQGEVVAFTGPSGSGKTTLLSLLGCMTRPTSGRILVDGRDVAKLGEENLTAVRRAKFGFIFQQYHLITDLSVIDNVLLPLLPLPMGTKAMNKKAGAVIERLGLGAKRRRKIRQLSGGEQQRVAIARALVNDPPVIVADEPTAHLDRHLAVGLMDFLGELNRDGKTLIIATHDPLVFEHPLITRTLGMRDGRVISPESQ